MYEFVARGKIDNATILYSEMNRRVKAGCQAGTLDQHYFTQVKRRGTKVLVPDELADMLERIAADRGIKRK